MSGGIVDSNPVNAAYTNSKLASKDGDNTFLGQQTLNKSSGSGGQVDDSQKELNSLNSYTGKNTNSSVTDKPSWSSTDAGTNTDSLVARGEALTVKFNSSSGHDHSGSGQGKPISANNLINVNYQGYVNQGTDLTGITGTSTVVTTQLTGKSPSTNSTTLGVVVNNPKNKIIITQASGVNEGDSYLDGSGNIVYGRLTESSGVWTLSFYTLVSSTETAYTFSSKDIRWYYQEIYNPLSTSNPPPVYNGLFYTPSDNSTADVVDASSTQRGVVSTGTQQFAGNKEFLGTLKNGSSTGPVRVSSGVFGTGNTDLASEVTGVLPIANGGTNASTQQNALNNLMPASVTKGDIAVYNGTNWVKFTHGSNGDTIVYDSTTSTGLKAGPGILYRAGTQSLSTNDVSKTITFSSAVASTSYRLSVMMLNSTDASPQFQPITITNKTTSGFTAKWNAGVDSANYSLEYIAIGDL